MIYFIKCGNLGIVSTSKEFCIIIKDSIHGAFPKTNLMLSLILALFKDPDNEQIIESIKKEMEMAKFKSNHV